jgi:hypothetical protein
MKRLLLLPGNNRENKIWIEQIRDSLKDAVDTAHIQYYEHWQRNDGSSIDFEKEFLYLEKTVKEWGIDDEIYVFGKSAGTILTLYAIAKGILKPKNVFFCGVAIGFGKYMGLDVDDFARVFVSLVQSNDIKVLIIQQQNDRAGSFESVKEYFSSFEPNLNMNAGFGMLEVPGSDHGYTDFDLYIEKVKLLLKG